MGLLNLPVELMLLIFDDPNLSDRKILFTLSLVNRTLHHLCLPIYLKRCGVDISCNHLVINIEKGAKEGQLDAISGLKVALAPPSIEHLTFNIPASAMLAGHILWNLQRLRDLIDHLHLIRTVDIECDPNASTYRPTFRLGGPYMEQWSDVMSGLLNTILEKGCSSLQVRWKRIIFDEPYVVRFSSGSRVWAKLVYAISRTTRNSLKLGMQGVGWKYVRSGSPEHPLPPDVCAQLSESARNGSKLESLTLTDELLFSPPFIHWTLSVLRTFPITCLAIHQIRIGVARWTTILDIIASSMPQLRQLTIDGCRNIPLRGILALVSATPHIQEVSLGSVMSDQTMFGRRRTACHLTRLCASPTLIAYLLPPPRHRILLPDSRLTLKALEICWSGERRTARQKSFIAAESILLLRCLKQHEKGLNLALRIALPWNAASQMAEDVSLAENHPAIKEVFRRVSLINLRIVKSLPNQPQLVQEWLEMFQGAKQLRVVGWKRGYYHPASVLREAIRNGKLGIETLHVDDQESTVH